MHITTKLKAIGLVWNVMVLTRLEIILSSLSQGIIFMCSVLLHINILLLGLLGHLLSLLLSWVPASFITKLNLLGRLLFFQHLLSQPALIGLRPVKQSMKHKMCSNFQKSFLHLVRWPPIVEALAQVEIFVRSSGQADLWSDVPHIVEASAQIDIFVRSVGPADLWSDVPYTTYIDI